MALFKCDPRQVVCTCVLLVIIMIASPLCAETLSIGMSTTFTTLDPHQTSSSPNNATSRHIFDSLVYRDGQARVHPFLATEWRIIDDLRLEFKLRTDVKFHDGTDFNAEDVVASLLRARNMPGKAFSAYTRNIANVIAKDSYTVIVETKRPDPLILNSLSRLRIISADHADKDSAAFDKGEATIGTGPFSFVSYSPGDNLVLKSNKNYFQGPSAWETVTLRMIPDHGARLAALLSGDLDLIESLPAEAFKRVESEDGFHIIRGQSTRIVFLGMDQAKTQSPFVTGPTGAVLDTNPLKDPLVRRALLMSINRPAIIDRIMRGNATIAHQFVADGFFGHSERVEEVSYDPEGAKQLLAKAGWGDGFKMTIHAPSGRWENDSQVMQAVGQMFSRIGIETSVEVMPWSMYTGQYPKGKFSVYMASWGVNTGEVSNPAISIVAGRDADKGTGRYNGGGVNDEVINAILAEATATLADDKREALLKQVSELTFNNNYLVPLHYENIALGVRDGINYTPRSDKYTLAYEATLEK